MKFLSFEPRLAGLFLIAGLVASPCAAQVVQSSVPTMGQSTLVQSAVCPKCGRIHGNSGVQHLGSPVGSPSRQAPSIRQPNTVRPTSLRATGGPSNVLSALNAQRARQGLGGLQYDPSLQAVAARRAQLMASMGTKSHPPGSFSPGRYEGVGWSSSYSPAGVSACFTSDPNMRAAGAAMATGSDGVYFCVVYR